MTTFAIILSEPTPDDWEKLKQFPASSYYIVDDRVAFFSGKNVDLTAEISDMVGMNDDEKITGIVISVEWYDGWHNNTLWEWLARKEKKNNV
ncbi:MAG: hypothetical protein OXI60_03120 [Acidiferrobacterales bacterium]|nr:hypothetical protein [Acidiferrobacterales bacterium]